MSIWILLRDVGKVPVMQTFMLESLVGCDDDDDDDDDDDEDDDVCPTGRICTPLSKILLTSLALFGSLQKLAMLFATISPTPSTASRDSRRRHRHSRRYYSRFRDIAKPLV